MELSKEKGNEQPFLLIMAPPRCKAVDFLIFCQDKSSFVAVQVKSNTLTMYSISPEQPQNCSLRRKPRMNKRPPYCKQRRTSALPVTPSLWPALLWSAPTTQIRRSWIFVACSKRISLPSSHPFWDNSRVSLQVQSEEGEDARK